MSPVFNKQHYIALEQLFSVNKKSFLFTLRYQLSN